MKEKSVKAYAVILGQAMSVILTIYMVIYHLAQFDILLKPVKTHLWVQILLSLGITYTTFHFIKIIKLSSMMRKAAREQRESNSKRIEMLIYALTLSIVFASLFYTAPFQRYYPTSFEYGIYFYNTIVQLLLLISVMGTDSHMTKEFIKKKQTYAGVGVASGVLLFYVYVQMMT